MKRSACLALCLLGLATSVSLAGDADLIVRSAVIADRKPNGEGWDAFYDPPDPFVKVIICDEGGRPIRSAETESVSSDYRPSFPAKSLGRVGDRTQLIIQVWDKDLFDHDLIGEIKVTVTRGMLAEGSHRWTFDSVQDLRIDFRPTN